MVVQAICSKSVVQEHARKLCSQPPSLQGTAIQNPLHHQNLSNPISDSSSRRNKVLGALEIVLGAYKMASKPLAILLDVNGTLFSASAAAAAFKELGLNTDAVEVRQRQRATDLAAPAGYLPHHPAAASSDRPLPFSHLFPLCSTGSPAS